MSSTIHLHAWRNGACYTTEILACRNSATAACCFGIHTTHLPHRIHCLYTPEHNTVWQQDAAPKQFQELQLSSSTPTRVCFGAGTMYALAPGCSSNGRFSTSMSLFTCQQRISSSAHEQAHSSVTRISPASRQQQTSMLCHTGWEVVLHGVQIKRTRYTPRPAAQPMILPACVTLKHHSHRERSTSEEFPFSAAAMAVCMT